MNATTITVRGSASSRETPEFGTPTLTVGFENEDRGEVLGATSALHGLVVEQLGAQQARPDAGLVSWSSGQVRVWGERPWNTQGERLPMVYHSAATVTATFRDFELLSRWLDEVSELAGVTVQGVSWSLSEERTASVQTEVQKAAIADAVRKAEVYAAALGLRQISAVAISDPGLLPSESGAAVLTADIGGVAHMHKSSFENHGGIDLQPEDIMVEAEVHARFSAS